MKKRGVKTVDGPVMVLGLRVAVFDENNNA